MIFIIDWIIYQSKAAPIFDGSPPSLAFEYDVF